MKPVSQSSIIALGILLGMNVMPWAAIAAVAPALENGSAKEKNASGTFVDFQDGALTIRNRVGLSSYRQVGTSYQAYQNNEDGPGSKMVDTIDALRSAVPGTAIQVDVEKREILLGLDHRVTGTLESYVDGRLILLAADVPPGFIQKPTGRMVMTIDPGIPVLESINGGNFIYAGAAGTILPKANKGVLVTARSEFSADIIEVIQIGEPKRRIERYFGQTRATVRGAFVSFKDGILRLRGKGVVPLSANEYERMIACRIPDHVPIVESIDGGVYEPVKFNALKALKEGSTVTIRKVEEVVLEVQIGLMGKN